MRASSGLSKAGIHARPVINRRYRPGGGACPGVGDGAQFATESVSSLVHVTQMATTTTTPHTKVVPKTRKEHLGMGGKRDEHQFVYRCACARAWA